MGNMHRTDSNPASRDSGGAFNPSVHDIYWREAFTHEPYYTTDYTYNDYAPAYRTGYEAAHRYLGQNKRFDDVEPELQANYERVKGNSRLAWKNAKDAVRAAWRRVERLIPGDFDNDGR